MNECVWSNFLSAKWCWTTNLFRFNGNANNETLGCVYLTRFYGPGHRTSLPFESHLQLQLLLHHHHHHLLLLLLLSRFCYVIQIQIKWNLEFHLIQLDSKFRWFSSINNWTCRDLARDLKNKPRVHEIPIQSNYVPNSRIEPSTLSPSPSFTCRMREQELVSFIIGLGSLMK